MKTLLSRIHAAIYQRRVAWVWWVLTAAYIGLIFYLSEQPGSEIHLPAPDYLLHALAFGGLSFCLYSALRSSGASLLVAHGVAVLGTRLYGISDELHQMVVPGRVASVSDVIVDLVGALAVQTGLCLLTRVVPK